jgi:hypothetical protein
MEIFKEIIGYSDYLISNKGRVKTKSRKIRYTHSVTGKEHFRLSKERFLRVYKNDITGYKFIQPRKNKKPSNETIHRLVALTFINNPNNQYIVNHKDGNKHNNIVENLEWCTNKYNHKHATETGLKAKGSDISTSKLNEKSAHAIKYFLKKGFTHTELSKAFNVSRPTISLISEGVTWKHVKLTNKELEINL